MATPPVKLVTIYSPEGRVEQHTPANARDYVAHAKYTWEKKKPASPMDAAPFAVPPHKAKKTSAAQDVLDGAIKKSTNDESDEDESEEELPSAYVDEETVAEETEETEAEEVVEPAPRRGRKPKAATE